MLFNCNFESADIIFNVISINNVDHICADDTFKMIYLGYPMLMVGTTDMAKSYHPYGISLCLTENGDDYAFC